MDVVPVGKKKFEQTVSSIDSSFETSNKEIQRLNSEIVGLKQEIAGLTGCLSRLRKYLEVTIRHVKDSHISKEFETIYVQLKEEV